MRKGGKSRAGVDRLGAAPFHLTRSAQAVWAGESSGPFHQSPLMAATMSTLTVRLAIEGSLFLPGRIDLFVMFEVDVWASEVFVSFRNDASDTLNYPPS